MSEIVRLPTLLNVLTQAFAAQDEADRIDTAMAHLLATAGRREDGPPERFEAD